MSSIGKVGRPVRKLGSTGAVGRPVRKLGAAAFERPLEDRLREEVQAIDHGLNESMAEVTARLEAEISTDFWCCLVFQTREQVDAFLDKLGWDRERDGDVWVDGQKLAKLMRIDIPRGPTWKESRVKGSFAAFALPVQKKSPEQPLPEAPEHDDSE